MTTSLTTIDTNNFAAMAKAMGIAADTENAKKSSSTLARLRLQHTPILGDDKILVKAGQYKLEIPDGPTYYAQSVNLRPYLQRFMYKRFIKGHGDKPNRYVKTVMADNLNIDLKDNDGGFNCGKPAGYIQDFKALPEKTQNLIKEIKRVLPIQHMVSGNTQERKLPNGNSFYLPVMSLDVTKTLDLGDKEQETFADFMSWVENYNTYIINTWSEKASNYDDELDAEIASDIIDIDFDEEVA
jgi:hypothetical protein